MLITHSFKMFEIFLLVALQFVLSSKEKSFHFFGKLIILKLQFEIKKHSLFCRTRQYYSSVTYNNVNVSIVYVCVCVRVVRACGY